MFLVHSQTVRVNEYMHEYVTRALMRSYFRIQCCFRTSIYGGDDRLWWCRPHWISPQLIAVLLAVVNSPMLFKYQPTGKAGQSAVREQIQVTKSGRDVIRTTVKTIAPVAWLHLDIFVCILIGKLLMLKFVQVIPLKAVIEQKFQFIVKLI